MEEHIVTIDEDGTPTILVRGVKGGRCRVLTGRIETALGKTVSSTPTAEAAQVETATSAKAKA